MMASAIGASSARSRAGRLSAAESGRWVVESAHNSTRRLGLTEVGIRQLLISSGQTGLSEIAGPTW